MASQETERYQGQCAAAGGQRRRGEGVDHRTQAQNRAWTGLPLHHSTADGTVVDADPTLEEMMRHVAPDELPPRPAARPDVLPAVPVVHDWYERGRGRTSMQQGIARSHQQE
jgi:hypothetical protein